MLGGRNLRKVPRQTRQTEHLCFSASKGRWGGPQNHFREIMAAAMTFTKIIACNEFEIMAYTVRGLNKASHDVCGCAGAGRKRKKEENRRKLGQERRNLRQAEEREGGDFGVSRHQALRPISKLAFLTACPQRSHHRRAQQPLRCPLLAKEAPQQRGLRPSASILF